MPRDERSHLLRLNVQGTKIFTERLDAFHFIRPAGRIRELGTGAQVGRHATDTDEKDVGHHVSSTKHEHFSTDLDLGMQLLEQFSSQGRFEIVVLRFDATAWRDPVRLATGPRALDQHKIAILVKRECPHALIGSHGVSRSKSARLCPSVEH